MKKIILSITSGLFSLGLFAQDANFLVAASDSNVNYSTTSQMAACSQGSLADFNYALSGVTAFDMVVAANETFEVSKLTFQYLTTDGSLVDQINVVVYDSNNNLPGAAVETFSNVMITNQSVVGVFTTATGATYNINEVEYTFSAPFLLQEGNYWMSVTGVSTTSQAMFLIGTTTTANFIDEPAARYDTTTTTWYSSTTFGATPLAFEILYLVEGDCVLSIDQQVLSQISLYPNPAKDILNVQVPSNVEITGAVLYDVLGKNTGAVITNGQMNLSTLSRGVYMLSLETTAGTLVKKVVKQ